MKFNKLIKELSKLDNNVPAKFFYEGLKGDFFIDSSENIIYCERGIYANYQFSLKDFKRKDWQLVTR